MTERQRLKKKLDTVFSIWIRRRFADDAGFTSCYTCGVVKSWREVDAGHFQSRGKMSTRWHELNVFQQCKKCNGFKNGEQFKFARQLDADYGEGTAEAIERLSNECKRWTVPELREMCKDYAVRIKDFD